jgi:hypothetical protein
VIKTQGTLIGKTYNPTQGYIVAYQQKIHIFSHDMVKNKTVYLPTKKPKTQLFSAGKNTSGYYTAKGQKVHTSPFCGYAWQAKKHALILKLLSRKNSKLGTQERVGTTTSCEKNKTVQSGFLG